MVCHSSLLAAEDILWFSIQKVVASVLVCDATDIQLLVELWCFLIMNGLIAELLAWVHQWGERVENLQ